MAKRHKSLVYFFISEDVSLFLQRKKVSSQKSGAEKADHSDESRLEALSFHDDQRSQTTLPRNIEKIRKKVLFPNGLSCPLVTPQGNQAILTI